LIYVIFRWAKNYSCKLSKLITINYLTATLLGFGLFMNFNTSLLTNSKPWIPFGILLGVLFIVMFYLIGISSQKAGITITTLSNKLSLVFPVLFSLIYFNESISTLKYAGLFLAIIAVIFVVYKRDLKKTNLLFIVLPALIFRGSGLTDSVVKFVQAVKTTSEEVTVFSSFVFFVAFICGAFISIFRRSPNLFTFHSPTLFLGILLGAANFGSLYFLINALNKSNLNSSLVFALVNMSIVALSSIVGFSIFKEKLNKLNIAGIGLAIISLYFLL